MFLFIHTTYFQKASVQMAASANGRLYSVLKATKKPSYICAAAPVPRRCWPILETRIEQKNIHEIEKLSLPAIAQNKQLTGLGTHLGRWYSMSTGK